MGLVNHSDEFLSGVEAPLLKLVVLAEYCIVLLDLDPAAFKFGLYFLQQFLILLDGIIPALDGFLFVLDDVVLLLDELDEFLVPLVEFGRLAQNVLDAGIDEVHFVLDGTDLAALLLELGDDAQIVLLFQAVLIVNLVNEVQVNFALLAVLCSELLDPRRVAAVQGRDLLLQLADPLPQVLDNTFLFELAFVFQRLQTHGPVVDGRDLLFGELLHLPDRVVRLPHGLLPAGALEVHPSVLVLPFSHTNNLAIAHPLTVAYKRIMGHYYHKNLSPINLIHSTGRPQMAVDCPVDDRLLRLSICRCPIGHELSVSPLLLVLYQAF
jgi:hypothetical protein